jgi:hypothetical protein
MYMEKINHVILTRMNFKDEDLLKKYLKVTKSTLIPCLKSQTNKNFVWAIITNIKILPLLKEELNHEFIPFHSILDFNNFVKENKIEIQTRHDCDDFMSNNYIEKIQSIHEDKKKKSGEVSLIIHFQPTKLDFNTKKEYRMGKYNEKRNSMFLSLCQTNITKSIFEYKHGEMYKAAKEVILIDEGYVKLIAHGNNTLTRINPNEQEL